MSWALDEGGEPPKHPHIRCAGGAGSEGRGWAWHGEPNRRGCYVGEVAAGAELVSAAIDGRDLPGIDRMLAVVTLQAESPASIRKLFRLPCPACSANHRERVLQIIRAMEHIHPDAFPALRAAEVPEGRMRSPFFRDRNVRVPEDPSEIKRLLADPEKRKVTERLLAASRNLPVWPEDRAKTRLAQMAYAKQYAMRRQ